MLFNSYVFMLAFLPLTLLCYFLLGRLPEKIQLNKVFLVLASFLFYGYNNPSYVPIIAGSILINYALSQLMLTQQKKALRLPLMLLGLFLNLGVLFYFKYHDFFFENLNGAFGLHLTLNHLALPLGISFFTFQQLSYVIDSYKRTVPRYNILDYSLFVTFFPQLIAGPIVLHSEIVPQFMDPAKRRFQWGNFSRGLYAFALGMAKKVLLADVFGIAVNYAFANIPSLNSTNALIGVVGYIFQMYFDFSGYGDMAVGLGRMLGFEFMRNFNYPYISRSITEFWRRWHISLSSWLRDYLYISLGGNRKGRVRTYINLLLTMLLGGLWHGAAIRFVLWGALHGVALALHKMWLALVPGAKISGAQMHPLSRIAGIFLTFNLVCFGWLMFRAESMQCVELMLHQIFTNFNPAVIPQALAGYAGVFALIGTGYLLHMLPGRVDQMARSVVMRSPLVVQVLMAAVLIWCVMQIKSSDIQPFIYFQF